MSNNFIVEFVTRLTKENPKFFKIVQLVALIVGGLSAGFNFIDSQHVALPAWFSWIEQKEMWISSLITLILAQLPNEDVNQKIKP